MLRNCERLLRFTLLCIVAALVAHGRAIADETRRAEISAAIAYDFGNVAGAAALWRQAAEAGSRDAMVSLGGIHETGEIGRRDLPTAVDWYRQAAALGDALAMFRIAELTDREPSLTAEPSHEWLRRAAAAGHPVARERIAATGTK